MGTGREKTGGVLSKGRAVLGWLAISGLGLSLSGCVIGPIIGQFTGKNHSSVVLAVQLVEKMLAEDHHSCRWMTPAGPKTMPTKTLLKTLVEQLP